MSEKDWADEEVLRVWAEWAESDDTRDSKVMLWDYYAAALRAAEKRGRVAGLREAWQPIETAPKDGTWVFVYWPTMPISIYPKVAFNCGDEYEWHCPDDYGQVSPTRWMPIPEPPAADKIENGECE